MQNVNYTTRTVETARGNFDQEIWEMYGHTLTRVTKQGDDTYPADWRIQAPQGAPSLDNRNFFTEEGADYGVNWSAQGTRSAAEARTYALHLLQAAEVAEKFNEIQNGYNK